MIPFFIFFPTVPPPSLSLHTFFLSWNVIFTPPLPFPFPLLLLLPLFHPKFLSYSHISPFIVLVAVVVGLLLLPKVIQVHKKKNLTKDWIVVWISEEGAGKRVYGLCESRRGCNLQSVHVQVISAQRMRVILEASWWGRRQRVEKYLMCARRLVIHTVIESQWLTSQYT